MSTFQVIVLFILINGFCCHENFAKVSLLLEGKLHLVISTKFNWKIETYVYAAKSSSRKHLTSFIRNSQEYDMTDSINLSFYCEVPEGFDSKSIFESVISHRISYCWRNKQQIWKNVQTNFNQFEDLALYYTCTREEGPQGRNRSVLLLVHNKDSNQSNEVINYKINTAMMNEYPQFDTKINTFYEINNYIEFQKYLDNIGCGHLVKFDFKRNLISHYHYLPNFAVIILIVISALLLLGIVFCCYDNLRIKG